jgi:hypothetical protein
MSIFFPDNEKRKNRLLELSVDTQNFLAFSRQDYEQFKSLNAIINEKIAHLYTNAGLTPPAKTQLDILKAAGAAQDVNTADTAVEISEIFLDVAGMAATTLYLAPGVTSFLVGSGIMGAETAATVLGTVFGTEIAVGTLAGALIGGLIAGVVIIGIGLAIDAIEGAILRDKLRDGLHQLGQIRASTKLYLDRAAKLVASVDSVNRTLDALLSSHIPLTDQVIRNLLTKDVVPAIEAANAITLSNVIIELNMFDLSRRSWTVEDIDPHDIHPTPDKNVFFIERVSSASNLSVPDDLKMVCLADPNTLQFSSTCPVIKTDGYIYWPFSYIDNRYGMAIVAYDQAGRAVRRWDKMGARYIVKIDTDPVTNRLVLVGQSSRCIVVDWNELAVNG